MSGFNFSLSQVLSNRESKLVKAGACFRRPKFTGFCEAFLEGK